MMELRKIDPAKNMRGFYRLSVEPTLFVDFALVREWGRIGAKRGRIREHWHVSALDADAALAKALKRRIARRHRSSDNVFWGWPLRIFSKPTLPR